MLKRFVTLMLLVAVLLTGIAPAFASEVPVTVQSLAQSSGGLAAAIDAFMPNIPAGFGGVKVEDLAVEMLESAPFLLDVREASELEEKGFIPGAVNVPTREIADNLNLLPADLDAPIVVYCAKGTRGTIAMTALQVMGFTNVRNIKGGFGAYEEAQMEIATEMVAPEAGEAAAIDAELVMAVDEYLKTGLPQGWGQVTAEDLSVELLEAAPFLLDVREAAELEANGYLEGALNIPLREVAANLDLLPTDQPIVVYCAAGWRGNIAMTALQMLGYEVRNLAGGFGAWTAAELPVVKDFSMEAVIAGYMPTIPAGFGGVKVEDLAVEMLEAAPFLLDVREASELEEKGFIPGAVNVPTRLIADNLNLLPADLDAPIVVYCAKGTRGTIAMTALQAMGFTNVRNIKGGFGAYEEAQMEIATEMVEPVVGEAAAIDAELVMAVDEYLKTGLPQGWGQVTVEDLAVELLEAAPFLLDVREASELAEKGFIEGAVNVPLREVAANLDLLPADQPIVVYCAAGWRGNIAMTALQMLGYDVRNLAGGFGAWEAASMAVAN